MQPLDSFEVTDCFVPSLHDALAEHMCIEEA